MDKSKIVLSILVAIILAGWGARWVMDKNKNSLTPVTSVTTQKNQGLEPNLVNSQEFARLAENEDAFVIDVHTPKQTHIPGTDAFIPYDQIQENLASLPEDKSAPILVYCRSGSMSARASREIAELGYTNVYDLDGGTNAYKEQQVSVQMWPDNQELGTVIYGDVANTSFTITNYAPLPLKITRVSTSCGCTKASVEQEELTAYESTVVNVAFDPAVHKDDTDLGELTRTIYIETDNPNYPDLESTITANVIKEN
jgi:rhodanese-related sulfurtransferase